MKKTLLFSTLVMGIALTGCNRGTRTSTASTDTANTTTPSSTTTTTPSSTASTTTPSSTTTTTTSDLSSDVRRTADNAAASTREAGRDISDAARDTGQRMSDAMARAGDKLEAKYTEWKLNSKDIEADLAAHRPIVRTKSNADQPTGKIDRSTVKTAVEGRMKADTELANLKLDVNVNRTGEVELEGKAQNADQVARAMALALDTEGVTKVTSKVRLSDNATKR